VSYIKELLRRLKAWVESFAQKPYALWALFWIAFIEACIFPLPPDVLLIALGVIAPKKSIKYALITATGSFLGGYAGYYFGLSLFELIGKPVLTMFGMMGKFDAALQQYHAHGISALVISGFLPIPYIAFTMAAGFNRTISLTTLTIGSLIGRYVRFGLVGGLLYYFGPPVKVYLDRYFEKVSLALAGALILFFVILKLLL
jgi:membrane protein YqaA with SNARE-associated domain